VFVLFSDLNFSNNFHFFKIEQFHIFAFMKSKVTTKKIIVKNKAFIEAVKSSVSKRDELHLGIIEEAKKSGVLSKLVVNH